MFAQSSDPWSLKGFRKSQCSWPPVCVSHSQCLLACLVFSKLWSSEFLENVHVPPGNSGDCVYQRNHNDQQTRHVPFPFQHTEYHTTTSVWLSFDVQLQDNLDLDKKTLKGFRLTTRVFAQLLASPLPLCAMPVLRRRFWLSLKGRLEKLIARIQFEKAQWMWHLFR